MYLTVNKRSFQEDMRDRQWRARRNRKHNKMTPGVKAHDTMRLREELALNYSHEADLAIRQGFSDFAVHNISPAVKAHFRMGSYDKYLGIY